MRACGSSSGIRLGAASSVGLRVERRVCGLYSLGQRFRVGVAGCFSCFLLGRREQMV